MKKAPKLSRQRKRQLTYETTPKMITEEILEFCNGLAPDQMPVFVPVRPAKGCEAGSCFPNVARHVRAHDGESVFGWTIWQSPALLHAEFHCNWQGPDGKMVDITPKADGERRILFLPDPTRRVEWMKEEGEKGANFVDVEDFCELYGITESEFEWCVKEGMEVLQFFHGPRTIAKLEATHFGRMLMQRRAVADKPPLPGAEFYDDRAFVVKYQEKSCHLGNTIPFRLFKRLAARPGSYVDVETLKDCAWGHDEQIDTNCVHRHFTSLRKKLAEAGVTEFKFDGTTNKKHYALFIKG